MQISRRGKRLAVGLASRLLQQIGLRAGDQLPMVTGQDPVAVEGKEALRRQALERMAARNWTAVGPFDRDEANERAP